MGFQVVEVGLGGQEGLRVADILGEYLPPRRGSDPICPGPGHPSDERALPHRFGEAAAHTIPRVRHSAPSTSQLELLQTWNAAIAGLNVDSCAFMNVQLMRLHSRLVLKD